MSSALKAYLQMFIETNSYSSSALTEVILFYSLRPPFGFLHGIDSLSRTRIYRQLYPPNKCSPQIIYTCIVHIHFCMLKFNRPLGKHLSSSDVYIRVHFSPSRICCLFLTHSMNSHGYKQEIRYISPNCIKYIYVLSSLRYKNL